MSAGNRSGRLANTLPPLTNVTHTPSPLNSTLAEENRLPMALGATILGLVFLLGVPGNLFIIWSILARARKQSVTTLLILNLACADGSLMALTPFFIAYLVQKTWVFGNILCKGLFYLCLANMYASIQLIMLMSIHRLVAIVWPQHAARFAGRRTVLWLLLAMWILVLVASMPAAIFREVKDKNPNDKTALVCELFHKHKSEVVLQYSMELMLGFVIPYGVIVGSYICILRRIRQTKFRRRIRSEKLILAIVVTFCLFWLPYHAINMVKVAMVLYPEGSTVRQKLEKVWQTWRVITSSLAFTSSCANPVLYVFAGKSYIRRDGLAFMARLFEGTAPESATRKSRQNSQNSHEKDKEANSVMLKDKDSDANGKYARNGR